MTARLGGRRRHAQRLLAELVPWALREPDVEAVVLVGSYARGQERMASDVDVVLLTDAPTRFSPRTSWFAELCPGSRLTRTASWGPVAEQRYRLRSGLLVEVDLAPVGWAHVPLDPGTRRVLGDGCRVLHDPHGTAARAVEALTAP